MTKLLESDEAVAVVERALRRVFEGDEEDAWLALVEKSLGLPDGAVRALVYYPDHHGLGPDPTAEEVIAMAFQAVEADGWGGAGREESLERRPVGTGQRPRRP